jgi:hypothetical protein
MQRRMVRWLRNKNWKGLERKYPRYFPEGTGENQGTFQSGKPVTGPRFEPNTSRLQVQSVCLVLKVYGIERYDCLNTLTGALQFIHFGVSESDSLALRSSIPPKLQFLHYRKHRLQIAFRSCIDTSTDYYSSESISLSFLLTILSHFFCYSYIFLLSANVPCFCILLS